MQVDIAIVGAGPVGLCFARALAGSGLKVALYVRQAHAAIAQPAFDGREIALTHASREILERLGLWAKFDPFDISELRDARIFDGERTDGLTITARDGRSAQLGWLVPNQRIRQAAFDVVADAPDITVQGASSVRDVVQHANGVTLALEDGVRVEARLLIAADSRFAGVRRLLGIGVRTRDFGMRMLVCRVAHTQPHHHAAWEWFDQGQTLALLPLNGNRASVVLTLPPQQMAEVEALDDAAFAVDMQRRFRDRLGTMTTIGTRHVYPLVGVYADRFVAGRAALLGDAAVGMHPVTAHGFNLGLQGADRLAHAIREAHVAGRDIAGAGLLERWARTHRASSWPMYTATGLVASLYTDDRAPARLLRGATLRIAQRIAPFRRLIAGHLTQAR
ncbi:5-demethoxyubiquinol-8 5-hydroxylase UbiM [Luteimonas fraxinea]|uniref:5-demethoxyubiquinol-8 5-hydroxylase UbiM n=1 Tax=Luteimonas fraxinea TaxID=2901869 RepID=A0ABS8UAG4_9GAMM|nr:5-demethoxyubiquinol-8 5-hydroxylase UbiM [Luteimonas fraxinea]MCD9096044.1 5-demethoxyubiquinol-8 5-hydroxylase UbiM [Luteimonas fraxinea]